MIHAAWIMWKHANLQHEHGSWIWQCQILLKSCHLTFHSSRLSYLQCWPGLNRTKLVNTLNRTKFVQVGYWMQVSNSSDCQLSYKASYKHQSNVSTRLPWKSTEPRKKLSLSIDSVNIQTYLITTSSSVVMFVSVGRFDGYLYWFKLVSNTLFFRKCYAIDYYDKVNIGNSFLIKFRRYVHIFVHIQCVRTHSHTSLFILPCVVFDRAACMEC